MKMVVIKHVAHCVLLLPQLLQHVLANPTVPRSGNTLLPRADSSPEISETCPVMDDQDHQVTIAVGEVLNHVGVKDKLLAAWKGVDKVQLVAALASILGEASLGKLLLKDDSAVTDGLLAVPTVLVSLLGGVKALKHMMDPTTLGEWTSTLGLDVLEFGTQASIWTVCIMLLFEGILTTGFNGLNKPVHYRYALATHAGFLSLNLAQGAWEMGKDAQFSAGTGRLMDTLMLAGWRASYRTQRMMSGVMNFASRVLRRQQTAVSQAGSDATKLENFVPLTRELARIALEVGAVNQCMMDSEIFHDRTSDLQGGKSADICRAEWKDKFGHIYQNSGSVVGNEDTTLGDHAEMIRLTTLQQMTGGEPESAGSMLEAISMDAIGNVVPAIVFSVMMAVTGGHRDSYGTEAGAAIFGATTLLQSLFLGKSSKALYTMFRQWGDENPKALELAATVNHELQSGELKQWGDIGVEIDVMVLSSSAENYERHQGRFSIHNCPQEMQHELEVKLLNIATQAKVLRPEVFADTPQRFFGKMFRYSYLTDPRPSSIANVRRDHIKPSQGGAQVMTWPVFHQRFQHVDIGIILEHLEFVSPCVRDLRVREERQYVPWSLRPENREAALREGIAHLEEDPRW